jgi:hypothetical protein
MKSPAKPTAAGLARRRRYGTFARGGTIWETAPRKYNAPRETQTRAVASLLGRIRSMMQQVSQLNRISARCFRLRWASVGLEFLLQASSVVGRTSSYPSLRSRFRLHERIGLAGGKAGMALLGEI